jgi:hypothetical protein
VRAHDAVSVNDRITYKDKGGDRGASKKTPCNDGYTSFNKFNDPHPPYPRSAASFARSCVALIRRIVPERVRITSDSVLAPPALG